MDENYLTVEEVAEKCRVSPKTIKNHIRSGELKAYQIGRQYRITETDFREYLEKSKIN